MILKLSSADQNKFPKIFDQMYRSRASVFHDRLGWKVNVRDGLEYDSYDETADPIYVVALDEDDRLKGSLRILPTTGSTMINSEFSSFFNDAINVCGPTIWECTKFCILPTTAGHNSSAESYTSSELLIGLCELCIASGIEFIIGVYDHSMTRIYRRLGWSPELLAHARPEIGNISVGMWEVSEAAITRMKTRMLERSGRPDLLAA